MKIAPNSTQCKKSFSAQFVRFSPIFVLILWTLYFAEHILLYSLFEKAVHLRSIWISIFGSLFCCSLFFIGWLFFSNSTDKFCQSPFSLLSFKLLHYFGTFITGIVLVFEAFQSESFLSLKLQLIFILFFSIFFLNFL
jgi:hypothetical protein